MSTHSGLLSILVPVYNDAARLSHSLECICTQSYPEKQVIVYNDASTDTSLEVAQEYQKQYPCIEIVSAPENRGVVQALKGAYEHVKGEYVYSGSSNDYVRPGFFERAIALLQKYPHAGFSAGNVNAITYDAEETWYCSPHLNQSFVSSQEVIRNKAKGSLQFFGQSTIFRKVAFDQVCALHEELRYFSDLFCYFALSLTHGFVLTHHIESDIDNNGGFSTSGKNRKQQHALFQAVLTLLSTTKYAPLRKAFQKSGILAHLGPRFALEIAKSPKEYGFFSRNYIYSIAQKVLKKIIK